MAKQPTKKSRYKSIAGGGYITDGQYIVECIALKKAQSQNADLPQFFWRHPPWDDYFKLQILEARKLLERYSATAIISAIHKSQYIYSLYNKSLHPLIIKEQNKLDLLAEAERTRVPEKLKTDEKPREQFTGQTRYGKLRNLDG